MALFFRYIWQKRNTIGVLFLFVIIFGVTFFLYHLPIMAVVYPTLLCLLCGLMYLFVDFRRAAKKHRELSRIAGLSAELIDRLPETTVMEDDDYQAIIRGLQDELSALSATSSERYREMIDYYTIWAHQIKTPIASMRLHLQNEDSKHARQLQSDLFRIEQYVEMVLAFLRLDAETTDYVFEEHSLDAMIRGAVKKFSHEFIGRKLSLVYEPVNETIITDEKWFSFVLEQILSNALKYTREGSITISCPAPHTLCIEDTGIGIAPEDLPRIFEKGYTGYNGRSDKKASGIGLYLCRRVCDNLGIGITVASEMGRGTMITLALEQREVKQ